MTAYTKVDGSWKEVAPQAKINGEWKTLDSGYVKVEGEWKEFYISFKNTFVIGARIDSLSEIPGATSTDGISWTPRTISPIRNLSSLTYANNKFIGISNLFLQNGVFSTMWLQIN